jgi:hypothetical protein
MTSIFDSVAFIQCGSLLGGSISPLIQLSFPAQLLQSGDCALILFINWLRRPVVSMKFTTFEMISVLEGML